MPVINPVVLKKLIKDKGYTQSTFAEKIGLKRSTYAYKEKIGEFDEPELQKIIKALDISSQVLEYKTEIEGGKPQIPVTSDSDTRELIASLKREAEGLRREVELLKKENDRLEELCKTNSDLNRQILINRARTVTLMQQLAFLRAKVEKQDLRKIQQEMNTALVENLHETLKADNLV
jgi:transcriptional regulator with XRE-family HTH domain